MNSTTSRSNRYGARLSALLGTASLVTIANAIADRDRAFAAEAMVAQVFPEEIPENVLITGSLIRGTVAVGVPVVNLQPMDFAQTGALTTADLFKNFPAATIQSGDVGTTSAARIERGQKVNIRRLDGNNNVREIMLVDGMRTAPSGNGICAIDPSIIPAIALDHIDILVDGASATYGSDAITGVINVVLRRNYDGAQTQLRFTAREGGGRRYQVGQLWGRTWDGGQVTLSYEWYQETPLVGKSMTNWDVNFSPWGYDNKTFIGSSSPGTISTGAANLSNAQAIGTACGYSTGVSPITPSRCYSVPLGAGRDFRSDLNGGIGPTAPFSASTLNWTTFSQDTNFAGPLNPSAGTRNQFNPYSDTWYSPSEQRNGGAITVDQRLTRDISFYGSGFYSNRRSTFLNSNNTAPGGNSILTQVPVPTFNPYYPTGTFCPASGVQPANCLPTNLRVNYDISIEQPVWVAAYELAARYQVGLNIALPAEWEAQIFYSMTYSQNTDNTVGAVNRNAISAALGWTIAALPPQSFSGPSFGTWTKPGAVPYLNLFCDPFAFQCNSKQTLNYIQGGRYNQEKWWINEKGVKADGPLFDLPGGTVKMAVGADLTNNTFSYLNQDNTGGANLTIAPTVDALHNNVWAVFTQVNIPVFGDDFNFPGFRRMEWEVSWRHDQYDTVGGTSNPKIAFNWTPIDDFTIKGGWGSNFRAPQFAEVSTIAKAFVNGFNLPASQSSNTTGLNTCPSAASPLPPALSGAGKLQQAAFDFNNAMAAAGAPGYTAATGCINTLAIPQPTAPYVNSAGQAFAAFAQPGITASVNGLLTAPGMDPSGGAAVNFPLRQYLGYGLKLTPETATNWSVGFDYAPTNFLRGLDIQATYWIIKITNILTAFTNPSPGRFTDPTLSFAFPSPQEIGCPTIPNSVRPSIPIPANLVPSACPQWMNAIAGILTNPKAAVLPTAATLLYWINDGAEFNQGWVKRDGIDWNISYDWDMGDIGAFNVGATGSYDLHSLSNTLPGSPLAETTDGFHTTVGSSNAEAHGVSTVPLLRYRGRLGWSNGPWNVTGFMDYQSHYYHTQAAPPNVNGNTCIAAGLAAGGTFPCVQNGYTNLVPGWVSFDLSVGYDTGEDPANDYLKNIGLQFVVQNLFGKHADMLYKGQALAGPISSINPDRPNFGRQISFIITKTW